MIDAFKASPDTSAFVLDFDGTLSLIVEEPGLARPISGAARTLRALGNRYSLVAVVSGRPGKDLYRMLGSLEPVRYLGVYGAEEMLDGNVIYQAEAETWRGMASRLARDAEALIVSEGLAGCHVEYKDIAVSVHYRQAASERAGEAIMAWATQAAPRRGFSAGLGRKVVEMRPAGVSKAVAVKGLLSSAPVTNLFIAGDDQSDAEPMEYAHSIDLEVCLTVGVSSEEGSRELRDAADLLVESPPELLRLLQGFL